MQQFELEIGVFAMAADECGDYGLAEDYDGAAMYDVEVILRFPTTGEVMPVYSHEYPSARLAEHDFERLCALYPWAGAEILPN